MHANPNRKKASLLSLVIFSSLGLYFIFFRILSQQTAVADTRETVQVVTVQVASSSSESSSSIALSSSSLSSSSSAVISSPDSSLSSIPSPNSSSSSRSSSASRSSIKSSFSASSPTSSASSSISSSISTSSISSTPALTYKNGIYSVSGTYTVPGGESETITIKITINNDNVTALEDSHTAGNPTSKGYHDRFTVAVEGQTVNKKLSGISLSRVAGASLTTAAFNRALNQIKTEAGL